MSGASFDADDWRRASILTVGRLIARAALRREESRGGHYRSDFPKRDDINWKRGSSTEARGTLALTCHEAPRPEALEAPIQSACRGDS